MFIFRTIFLAAINIAILSNHLAHADSLIELEQFINDARNTWQVPGAAVVVVQDDKVVFIKGFGVTHQDSSQSVNGDTIFQLASVSKTFTAALMGIAIDRNLIKWDDLIINHLPHFALYDPYATLNSTPRDLLAHRTGLPSFHGDLLCQIGYSNQEIVERVRYIQPETTFRNHALYSNVGFFLAGEVIANTLKSSFGDALKTHILSPLKMMRSGLGEKQDTNSAGTYRLFDGRVIPTTMDTNTTFAAAGGVTSTATDLGNWLIMLLNEGQFNGNQILKPETIKAMFTPSMTAEVGFSEAAPINADSSFGFGLGWDNYNYQGRYVVEKAGGLDGVRTIITLIPSLKMGIAVMCNLNLTLFPESIRAKFLELYVAPSAQDIQKAIREQATELAKLFSQDEQPKNALPKIHQLEQYEGTYSNDLYGAFLIEAIDNELSIKAGPTMWPGRLSHWSNDTFILTWPLFNYGHQSVTFTFGPDGKAISFQTETLGIFNRISNEQKISSMIFTPFSKEIDPILKKKATSINLLFEII